MSKERVMVAMSGGVDSSTAAALLKEQGYEVTGVGLRLPGLEGAKDIAGTCCGMPAMEDARRVAANLGIAFHTLNYKQVFVDNVIDYFCRSYLEGKTPNPCVECNRVIKFGKLLDLARASGIDHIATGHYARIENDDSTGRSILKKGVDPDKDQSYFLYCLSQEQLSHTMFPLGGMTKEETRKTARSLGLHIAEKPGSQDICFLGDGDYRQFLSERFPEAMRPGPVVDRRGRTLGDHSGVANFTVGQRRKIGIASATPLYVLSTNVDTSTVVVGEREEMRVSAIDVSQTNWIVDSKPGDSLPASVRTRYRQAEMPATVLNKGDGLSLVTFSEPQITASAPGQSVVFYSDDTVLGGGIVN